MEVALLLNGKEAKNRSAREIKSDIEPTYLPMIVSGHSCSTLKTETRNAIIQQNMAWLDSTNRMWFSVVLSLFDHDRRHHSDQNAVDSRGAYEAQPSVSIAHFDHCDDSYRCR